MLFAPAAGPELVGQVRLTGVSGVGVMGGTHQGPTPAALGTAAGVAALRMAAGAALGWRLGAALARPEQRHRVREALLTELRSREVTTLRTDVVFGTAERLE